MPCLYGCRDHWGDVFLNTFFFLLDTPIHRQTDLPNSRVILENQGHARKGQKDHNTVLSVLIDR